MINIHGHIFDFRFVPSHFITLSNWMLKKPKRLNAIAWLLKNTLPIYNKGKLDKYARFLETIGKSQESILLEWKSKYPGNTMFCPLTIDMEKMGRGQLIEPYLMQVAEVIEIAKKNTLVRPFIMIDPRSDNLEDLMRIIKDNHLYLSGIKLYPLIGYYPTDERLSPFFSLCKKFNLSVISHCSPKNAVYYSGKDIDDLLDSTHPSYYKARGNKKKAGNFAHPSHIITLAKKYPDINFCLAHFGGTLQWREIIIDAVAELSNIYTDISFTFDKNNEQKTLYKLISEHNSLQDKVLFGDDSYMIKTIATKNPFSQKLKKNIGDYWYKKISEDNPIVFLKVTLKQRERGT